MILKILTYTQAYMIVVRLGQQQICKYMYVLKLTGSIESIDRDFGIPMIFECIRPWLNLI